MPIMTPEIKEMIRKVHPYRENGGLRSDTPDDIREMSAWLDAWAHDVMDGVQ